MDEHAYVVNVEGAVVRDGEYLLVERAAEEDHAAGTLAFPGGKVEQAPPGDAPVEATVRRELSEEVGIEVGAVEYSHSRTFETDTGVQCLNIVTRCRYESGTASPREPEEVAAVHWLGAEELGSHDDVPGFLWRDIERIESQRPAAE
jgi:8-oxo-dGTP diphosphatase